MFIALRFLPKTTNLLRCTRNTRFVPAIGKFYTTKSSSAQTSDGQITIGDVTKELKTPANPELVPQKYGNILNI